MSSSSSNQQEETPPTTTTTTNNILKPDRAPAEPVPDTSSSAPSSDGAGGFTIKGTGPSIYAARGLPDPAETTAVSSTPSQHNPHAKGLGWLPDVPDIRDQYFELSPELLDRKRKGTIPSKVDLRETGFLNFPLLDQGNLGSCTANAISAAVTYAMLKQGKTGLAQLSSNSNNISSSALTAEQQLSFFSPSRLFIYYNERVRINTVNSDSGAIIRDGIKSLNKEGACKEATWPYNIPQFTVRPSQVSYQEALNYQAIQYRRLDNTDITSLKGCLALGYPFVMGFSVYSSFMTQQVADNGVMPMPSQNEKLMGGHAVLAVGYDDARKVFILRNSWGDGWGDKGYFYMPYDYITNSDLAADFWTITMME